METNLITDAINMIGLLPLAKGCNVSYQAVRKWERAGRLPRTDYTGETHYAQAIERLTEGRITREALLKLRAA